jgi:hypothetical protein
MVCRHLGIPFHRDMLRHDELPHTELFENGLTVGDTNPQTPIQSGSVRQWHRFLSPEEVRLVEGIAGVQEVPAVSQAGQPGKDWRQSLIA